MTKDEALKLALEALQWSWGGEPLPTLELQAINAIKEVLAQPEQESDDLTADDLTAAYLSGLYDGKNKYAAQPEQEQEPVAIKRMKEWIEYLKRKSDFGQHMKIPSEMNAGTCWELALELEQFINTTPPQRQWVGLTDEEIDIWNIVAPSRLRDFVRCIEAKLREKNGC